MGNYLNGSYPLGSCPLRGCLEFVNHTYSKNVVNLKMIDNA